MHSHFITELNELRNFGFGGRAGRQVITAVPKNFVLDRFFFRDVDRCHVKSIRSWDPSGFLGQIGHLEDDGESAGATGAVESTEGSDGLLASRLPVVQQKLVIRVVSDSQGGTSFGHRASGGPETDGSDRIVGPGRSRGASDERKSVRKITVDPLLLALSRPRQKTLSGEIWVSRR